MIDDLEEGDGHLFDFENTTMVAWQEGFEDFFGMIMDAVHWNDDNEFGFFNDKGFGNEITGKLTVLYYEAKLDYKLQINNGMRSELYIA